MSNCGHCGANLTPADMGQPTCRYCGTVLGHYARAAEKVAVVNALMGDANRRHPHVLEAWRRWRRPDPMPPACAAGGHRPLAVGFGRRARRRRRRAVGAQAASLANAWPGRYGA